jgi:diguanylate cyclase (GGDEF)-like protein/PAS domain S-box-containing protein
MWGFHWFNWQSLRTRVTVATFAIFLVSAWALTYFAYTSLRADMERQISERQLSTARIVAGQTDDEINDRLSVLTAVAARVPLGGAHTYGPVQVYQNEQLALHPLFNLGTFILNSEGVAVADYPTSAGRKGTHYMDRDYAIETLQRGKSIVSNPVVGRVSKLPVIALAVPIRNALGVTVGALVGVTTLDGSSFLDRVTKHPYGKTGGYLLISPEKRQVITATDKSRISERLPAAGVNPVLDMFLNGYEGSQVFTNPHGLKVLASVARLSTANVMAVVMMPVEEAFQPVDELSGRMLAMALLMGLIAAVALWWVVRWQFQPLVGIAGKLAHMASPGAPLKALVVTRQDEVGVLIHHFNRLIDVVALREAQLHKSQRTFRQLVEITPEATVISLEGVIAYANPTALQILGAAHSNELVGRRLLDLVHPESLSSVQEHLALVQAGELCGQYEAKLLRIDGTTFVVEAKDQQLPYEGRPGIYSFFYDLSERQKTQRALEESHAFNISVLNSMDSEIAVINSEGVIQSVNQAWKAFAQANGAPDLAEKSVGMNYLLVCQQAPLHAGGAEAAIAFQGLQEVLSGREEFFSTEYACHSPSALRWFQMNVSRLGGVAGGAVIVHKNITVLKQTAMDLGIAAHAFEVNLGMFVTDAHSVILRANRACAEITGYAVDELVGSTPMRFKSGRQGSDFYQAMWKSITADGFWHGELVNRKKSGEEYVVELTISAVKDSSGEVSNFVASFSDITERKRMEAIVHQMAFFDALTQLPNRRLLLDRLSQAMGNSRRTGLHGALLFIDLDNFKPLNDRYGHEAGDQLLIEAAKRLIANVRETDSVSRFGGDEFVVMLVELNRDKSVAAQEALAVAELIRAALSRTYFLRLGGEVGLAAVEHQCSASIGFTLFFNHDSRQEEILKRADEAMYQAKSAGRNQVWKSDSDT